MPSQPTQTSRLDDTCDLARLYAQELGERIREFERAWDAGDMNGVIRLAHQMKGAAGGYGHAALSAAAADLESALTRAGSDPASAGDRYAELIRLCRRAAL